jgi:hypothetical protein
MPFNIIELYGAMGSEAVADRVAPLRIQTPSPGGLCVSGLRRESGIESGGYNGTRAEGSSVYFVASP